MPSRENYRLAAKYAIKQLRAASGLTYAALAKKLTDEDGIKVETQGLINRINDGNFSLAFTFRLLKAMDTNHIYSPLDPRDAFTKKE